MWSDIHISLLGLYNKGVGSGVDGLLILSTLKNFVQTKKTNPRVQVRKDVKNPRAKNFYSYEKRQQELKKQKKKQEKKDLRRKSNRIRAYE